MRFWKVKGTTVPGRALAFTKDPLCSEGGHLPSSSAHSRDFPLDRQGSERGVLVWPASRAVAARAPACTAP